jgi:ferredoxin-NADP reductase/ferredoxin
MNSLEALRPHRPGFRRFKVVEKMRESSVITSFHLEPLDPDGWQSFAPGQFLVFRISKPDGSGTVLRNYSLSSPPSRHGSYRITVKREDAPGPGLPAGLCSTFLHDKIDVGDTLEAQGPRGSFILDRSSARPVVLLSGGVGLTPMVAMLHDLAAGNSRQVHFIHACDNGEVHALRDEVESLCATRPGLMAHFCYRRPTPEDEAANHHHSSGLVSKELLQKLLPLDDYDVYLCGPPPFMSTIYETIRGLGVSRDRIAYEVFGPATVLGDEQPARDAVVASREEKTDGIEVEFRRSGVRSSWTGTSESLLAFAEGCGLSPAFSCRAGICSTCKCRLLSGNVTYFEEPLNELGFGEVLLCCARPISSVVVDI